MGRPDDVRLKQSTKNSSDIELLKELVKQQAEMIKSLVDTLAKTQSEPQRILIQSTGSPIDFDTVHKDLLEEKISPSRPKMDSFFINPSSELTITDSVNLTENKEEKIVKENIDEEAEKLKSLMKRRR
jgi:inner membrane protein involved in colicin E2 resistance